jgi:hypothetical protein
MEPWMYVALSLPFFAAFLASCGTAVLVRRLGTGARVSLALAAVLFGALAGSCLWFAFG